MECVVVARRECSGMKENAKNATGDASSVNKRKRASNVEADIP